MRARNGNLAAFRLLLVYVLCITTLGMAGCAQTVGISSMGGTTPAPSTTPSSSSHFPDIPVPPGSKVVVNKTLVFGTKPSFGQLSLYSSTSANHAFDFFHGNLTSHGWEEITSVRAPTSILTYADPHRVLAIAIRAATITGSEITITVSPRGQPNPPQDIQGSYKPPPASQQ